MVRRTFSRLSGGAGIGGNAVSSFFGAGATGGGDAGNAVQPQSSCMRQSFAAIEQDSEVIGRQAGHRLTVRNR